MLTVPYECILDIPPELIFHPPINPALVVIVPLKNAPSLSTLKEGRAQGLLLSGKYPIPKPLKY